MIKTFEIQNTEMFVELFIEINNFIATVKIQYLINKLAFENLKLSKNFIRINDSKIPIKPIKFS